MLKLQHSGVLVATLRTFSGTTAGLDFGCLVVESSLIIDVHNPFTHVVGIDYIFALDRHAFLVTFY